MNHIHIRANSFSRRGRGRNLELQRHSLQISHKVFINSSAPLVASPTPTPTRKPHHPHLTIHFTIHHPVGFAKHVYSLFMTNIREELHLCILEALLARAKKMEITLAQVFIENIYIRWNYPGQIVFDFRYQF